MPGAARAVRGDRGHARALGNPTSWTAAGRFPPGVRHDGTVTVDETRLDGMSAFAEVDATHTWIMNDARVHQMVVRYLRDGAF